VGAIPALTLTPVVAGLSFPVLALGAPGDATRLYVVEREGRIRIVENGVLLAQPFLDITAACQGPKPLQSAGLLGLAFHPGYAQNGRFFVHYVPAMDGQSIVAEYARSAADPNLAEASATQTLLVMDDLQAGDHNGGMITFGKDGKLYAGLGDGGGQEDPYENGQNLQTKLGKLLRFDVDTHPAPPPGNLAGANAYVWDYGLRNPWRFSVDRCTGDLYIADVGQYTWEEVDVEPAGQGNKNYGWDEMEGDQCFEPSSGCDMSGTPPTLQYGHNDGCSITGGYVYRGTKIPELVGYYLYGDWCSNRVWAFKWENGSITTGPIELTADLQSDALLTVGLASFGEGSDGELYVVDLGGTVFRIDAE
jgi:glucose/arabinose dehydrogenase